MLRIIRKTNASLIAPIMKLTGFRFSKLYRHEATTYHKIVYRLVDTVGANWKAEGFKASA